MAADESSSEVVPIETMANFEWINENIIEPTCLACHNTSSPAAGLLMTNYTTVMASVVAGEPELSPFYNRSFSTTFFKLSSTEQEIIFLWIEKGALDDTNDSNL